MPTTALNAIYLNNNIKTIDLCPNNTSEPVLGKVVLQVNIESKSLSKQWTHGS